MLAATHFSFLNRFPLQLSGFGEIEEQPVDVSEGVLTRRQEVIAQLIARGQSLDSIADELGMPARAVEGHVYRILETLGLLSMEELTEGALEGFRARVEPRHEPLVSELLTVAEIATGMRVSRMTVYRLVQAGALDSVRFGRSYRVTRHALQQYLDSINPA
jgi:excisionase family DNA binding protein